MRRFRLVRSRLRKARNAAGPEYSSELAEHFRGIRDMMQSVKANDTIDTFGWQIDPAAVEEQESWLRQRCHHRHTAEQLLAKRERRR